ncbi:MAG: hypothetical protein ACTHJT_10450 [Cytophaga sp.]|uniref:hypothetical protein n=1 Tax=Cytophaga sp. TaxID=29535 RepID=UPI003F7D0E4E
MKRYSLLSGLFLLHLIAVALDAKSVGAKGDGIQEDAPYLNLAIARALLIGEDLFIPAGTYKCEQFGSPYNKILLMDQPGVKTIRIYGEAGTKITTSQPKGCLLYIFNNNLNVSIENIFFENTHAITLEQTNALQLLGTNENLIINFTVRNCRFEGFSTAISAQGVKGLFIYNNVFASPRGHDDAQDSSAPAVYIWLADNANGQCYHVKIVNNVADGYTGSNVALTHTKRAMDGFVIAIAYGLEIISNETRNFSEEHLIVQPPKTFPDSKDTTFIEGNKFFQAIPLGSMKNGTVLNANYGIRAECNYLKINNNIFNDFSLGILMLPFEIKGWNQHSVMISANKFYSAKTAFYHVREAIKIQGNGTNPAADITISGNSIQINSIVVKSNRSAISLYDCKNVLLENNRITLQGLTLNGFTYTPFLKLRCLNVVSKNNNF